MKTSDSILECIGNTPMVWLERIARDLPSKIGVKCEYMNPSGSIKDRMVLRIVGDAEMDGRLKPGYTIIDASTGNTGIALSLVGTRKGYRVAIYMPDVVSEERKRIIERYGAELVLLPIEKKSTAEESIPGAEVENPARRRCLEEERRNPKVFWARQFSNPSNVEAHRITGIEIIEQCGGRIDAFVASVGTGGTLMGVAKTLRAANPKVKIVAVEPAASTFPLLSGYKQMPGATPEISGGIIKEMAESNLVNEVVKVSDKNAVAMARRLVRDEGLAAGVSSGANVLVALQMAARLPRGSVVTTVLPDSLDRYLTSEHYTT